MKKKTLVFSGHMIDSPKRAKPRFPKAIEQEVKNLILEQLIEMQPIKLAIAGAASGSDILFHECCIQLGIRSQIILADEIAFFLGTSVKDAGEDWVRRYQKLISSLPLEIVRLDTQDPPGMNIFSKTNHQMLQLAKKAKNKPAYLLVVLDEQQTGQHGGTFEMMQEAEKAGLKVKKIDLSQINGRI